MEPVTAVVGILLAGSITLGLMWRMPSSTRTGPPPVPAHERGFRAAGLVFSDRGTWHAPAHPELTVVPRGRWQFRILGPRQIDASHGYTLHGERYRGQVSLVLRRPGSSENLDLDPTLRELAEQLLQSERTALRVDDRVAVDVNGSPEQVVALLGPVEALRSALWRLRLRQVGALLDRFGIPEHALREPKHRFTVDGVQLVLTWPVRAGTGWQTVVRGSLITPLPPGTQLQAAGRGAGPDVEVDDLFLDVGLHIYANARDQVRERLARDEVRGPLLALVNDWPLSTVTATAVVHVVVERSCRPLAVVERVVELVKLLG